MNEVVPRALVVQSTSQGPNPPKSRKAHHFTTCCMSRDVFIEAELLDPTYTRRLLCRRVRSPLLNACVAVHGSWAFRFLSSRARRPRSRCRARRRTVPARCRLSPRQRSNSLHQPDKQRLPVEMLPPQLLRWEVVRSPDSRTAKASASRTRRLPPRLVAWPPHRPVRWRVPDSR